LKRNIPKYFVLEFSLSMFKMGPRRVTLEFKKNFMLL
jgi:hypothetical protein